MPSGEGARVCESEEEEAELNEIISELEVDLADEDDFGGEEEENEDGEELSFNDDSMEGEEDEEIDIDLEDGEESAGEEAPVDVTDSEEDEGEVDLEEILREMELEEMEEPCDPKGNG